MDRGLRTDTDFCVDGKRSSFALVLKGGGHPQPPPSGVFVADDVSEGLALRRCAYETSYSEFYTPR